MMSISQKYPWFERYNQRFSRFFPERSLFQSQEKSEDLSQSKISPDAQNAREKLEKAASEKIPQSMLWVAPPGLSMEEFAREKAQDLLSYSSSISNSNPNPNSNSLGSASQISNLLWISPESGSSSISSISSIKVDQIRALIDFMNLKTFSGIYRLVVVEQADRMNINAQNALLKTLEEPYPNAFIWLLTSHPKRLLPTVRSRCQEWSFFVEPSEAYQYFSHHFPDKDPGLLWKQCHFGPLNILDSLELNKALEHLKNQTSPLFLAGYYADGKEQLKVSFILDFLYHWILDWHRVHLGGEAVFLVEEKSWFEKYDFSAARFERMSQFLKKILRAKKSRAEGLNLNLDLMLEDIFIDWVKV
jgi:DNA polymerase-3 subunit delta'